MTVKIKTAAVTTPTTTDPIIPTEKKIEVPKDAIELLSLDTSDEKTLITSYDNFEDWYDANKDGIEWYSPPPKNYTSVSFNFTTTGTEIKLNKTVRLNETTLNETISKLREPAFVKQMIKVDLNETYTQEVLETWTEE